MRATMRRVFWGLLAPWGYKHVPPVPTAPPSPSASDRSQTSSDSDSPAELNEQAILDTIAEIHAKKTKDERIAAIKKLENDKKLAVLRSFEKRKNVRRELLIYLGTLALFATLAAVTFLFAIEAFPAMILIGVVTLATNYIWHSRNWRITVGRGVAITISIATAALAFSSVIGAMSFLPLPIAIMITAGCFLANVVLYRYDVPKAVDDIFKIFVKDPNKDDSQKVRRTYFCGWCNRQ